MKHLGGVGDSEGLVSCIHFVVRFWHTLGVGINL